MRVLAIYGADGDALAGRRASNTGLQASYCSDLLSGSVWMPGSTIARVRLRIRFLRFNKGSMIRPAPLMQGLSK
ncbi:MAG: hypothetical protein EBX65_10105 [Betaproteobacteria bacterium]|nr:hypothetical protein [Betaproteobacteria bacterium]